MDIQKNGLNLNSVAFSGHKKTMDKTGYEKHKFFYLFDPEKYNCEVEFFNIDKDKNGNYIVADKGVPASSVKMLANNVSINMDDVHEIYSKDGFAYRFKLTDKNSQEVTYAFDNGSVINIFDENNTDNKYNLVLNNRAMINKNGPMQLVMTDGFNPGVVNRNGTPYMDAHLRQKALNSVRTHANKLGGNFYGIIEKLPQLKREGIVRIVGTPFTQDSISSHKYWTENAYQISPDFGTTEDYKALQEELFKNGMNWISDAALVNEGFGGVHMSELLRKGQDSVSKNMFRADEKISLGIIPDNSQYTRVKFVNSPINISDMGEAEKNVGYNPAKPTYIQFYDDRLTSEVQKHSDERITTYFNKNTENVYDITKHDDAVYPYSLEVNPQELTRNINKVLKTAKTVDLSDIDTIKNISDFSTFNVVKKSESAGLEVWDGNVDIAKLNFYRCANDDARFSKIPVEDREEAIADFERGTLAVRDYAINSGKYWTKLTDDIQFSYVSNLISNAEKTPEGYMQAIDNATANGNMPKSVKETVDKEVIENVLNDSYHLRRLDDADMRNPINPEGYGNDYTVSDYILRHTMDMPLEIMPVSTNILGILTSPYIAKKANTDEELGVSRYDIHKAQNPNLPEKYKHVYEQTEKIYTDQIVPKIQEIALSIPGVSDEKGDVTEYGKYVISEMAPDLTKFILLRALDPDCDIWFKNNGQMDFSDINPDDVTMQALGIPYNSMSSEEEAQALVDIIKKGINKIDPEDFDMLKNKMQIRFQNRTLEDFKIAEMIMDRTESGLGWRIDAAKDIASIDTVRSNADDMISTWDKVIDFWKRYNESVTEINPHAYTTAEITDLGALVKTDETAKYMNGADAEKKFLEETGITSLANYNYLFTMPPTLYSNYNPDEDDVSWNALQSRNSVILDKLDKGWSGNPGFLFQSPADGVINSYTFVGNHDKPRIIHNMALDMLLYNAVPLSDEMIKHNQDIIDDAERKRAEDPNYNDGGASYRAGQAIKRDERLKQIAPAVLKKYPTEINYDKVSCKSIAMGLRINQAIDETVADKDLNNQLKTAVSHLASGIYKGADIDADAFGTRTFETAIKTVLDDAEYKYGKYSNRKAIETKLLESILVPAFDRVQSISKLLTLLPGSPTDFAGDKLGVSGYETSSKNYHQQNRNTIPWEYLDDDNYKFILDNYKELREISNLRTRKELSALNDGDTVTLPLGNDFVQAFIRYNDDSTVMVITDTAGSVNEKNERLDRNRKYYGNPLKDDFGKEVKDKKNGQTLCDGAINRIPLNFENASYKQSLKHGIKVGTKFVNARAGDESIYRVCKDEKGYYLKRQQTDASNKPSDIPIIISPEDKNALVLYKVD